MKRTRNVSIPAPRCPACGSVTAAHFRDCPIRTTSLTEQQLDILGELRSAHAAGNEWCRPMDLGGRDGSKHSNILAQLVKKGIVERRKRPTLANEIGWGRGSYEYRIKK